MRDYYNLKASASQPTDQASPIDPTVPPSVGPVSEIDKDGFDADAYVQSLLASASLETILRVEGELISEIKNLDGERKALVYDNYSKLIAATDTIRRMRTNMDPLTPATSTLSPAVNHIADTATSLSKELRERTGRGQVASIGKGEAVEDQKSAQRATVRWVLGTPKRMEELLDQGDNEAARAEYDSVQPLLAHWHGVAGVTELEARCEALLSE